MPDTYALYTRPLSHVNSQLDDPVPFPEFDKLVCFVNLFLTHIGIRIGLGGARNAGVRAADWVDHPEAIRRRLNPAWFPGLTTTCDVWVRTSDPATQVSVRLVDDEGTEVGAASTPTDATDWTLVTLAVSLATGDHDVTLQITGDNDTNDVYAHGAEFHGLIP